MTRKVLFVAHMDSHIANFHLPYLKWFQDHGYQVHVAANALEQSKPIRYCDHKYQVDFARSPFSLKNIKAYQQLKTILAEHEYALIHCHTPIGGFLTRLAARNRKIPVFYTAHGFHFYKGGPWASWLLFYPVERYLARMTTELITINQEDYHLAKRRFASQTNVNHIPGVGVDFLEHYPLSDKEKKQARAALFLNKTDFVMVYVGELTKGKNQSFLIQAMPRVLSIRPDAMLLLLGYGAAKDQLTSQIKRLKLENHVRLLGFRQDVREIVNAADLVVSSSQREGLPKCLLEALAMGKPILASNCRGNRDLVANGENGFLFALKHKSDFLTKLKTLTDSEQLREKMGQRSLAMAKPYEVNQVLSQMTSLYEKYL